MVSYGSLTNPFADVRAEIKRIAKGGFDYAELGIELPRGDPAILLAHKKEIKEILRNNGLPAIFHTVYWADLSSPYDTIRAAWVDVAKRCINVAAEFDAPLINFHSHAIGAFLKDRKYRKLVLDALVKSMRELVAYGKRKHVAVMLENAAERGEIRSFEDYRYVVDRVPGLLVHLDIGHANLWGKTGIARSIRYFGKKIAHVHISDNYGKKDDHIQLGKGTLDLNGTIKLLKSIGYDKTITFEIFTKRYASDQVKAKNKFKLLWARL